MTVSPVRTRCLCAGARDENNGKVLYELFHTDYFRITVTKDASTVEICGALKVCVFCGMNVL